MLTIILTSQNKSSTKYIDFKAIIPPQAVGQYSFLNFDLILEARVLYKLQYSFSIPLLFILEVRVLYKLQYFCRQNFTPTFIFNCHSLVWLSPSHTHTHTQYHQVSWSYATRFEPSLYCGQSARSWGRNAELMDGSTAAFLTLVKLYILYRKNWQAEVPMVCPPIRKRKKILPLVM